MVEQPASAVLSGALPFSIFRWTLLPPQMPGMAPAAGAAAAPPEGPSQAVIAGPIAQMLESNFTILNEVRLSGKGSCNGCFGLVDCLAAGVQLHDSE